MSLPLLFTIDRAVAAPAPPAMILPGQFNVGATGAASYTIPIAVPPGTGGMVPALSLGYSSQGGDGIVGLGWTLSGLPSISRCPKTIVQDGVHGSINFDDSSNASVPINDRLCLDGQRLVSIAGVYGRDGSEYRTELEGFSKIIVHGVAGINGPAWFEVHTKAGQTIEFGNTTSSRVFPVKADGTIVSTVVRTWAVDQISDSVGNYLKVSYVNDTTNGEVQVYPDRVDYTGHTSNPTSAPYNSVRFGYNTNRPDHAPVYQAGMQQQTTALLTDITTYSGASAAIYHYKLVYGNGSSTTHSRLTSVTLCGGTGTCAAPCDGGTNCLSSTKFGWQGGLATLAVQGVQNDIAHGKYLHYGNGTFFTANGASTSDFNADGLTDVIVLQPDNIVCPQGNTIYYGQLDGSFDPANMISHFLGDNGTNHQRLYYPDGPACFYFDPTGSLTWTDTVDLDGDGYTDVAAYNLFDGNTGHTMYMANDGQGNFNRYGPKTQSIGLFSDYNGDGLVDAVYQSGFAINQASSPGTFVLTPYSIPLGGPGPNDVKLLGDFDGDGCGDYLYQTAGGINEVFFNPICSTQSPLTIQNWTNNAKFITLGDFNGDGKTDVLVTSKTLAAVLYLSTGTSLVPTTLDSSTNDWGKYAIASGDWNGDGKTDIALIAAGGSGNYGPPSHVHNVMISTGTGFVLGATIANGASSGTTISTSVGDWNSDGTMDLWLQQAPHDFEELMSTQSGTPFAPELITTIDNGIGSVTNIQYNRLNDPSLYTRATDGAYPTQNVVGPFYVVSRVDASNGLGVCASPDFTNCYSSTYSYTGAKVDLSGRGFLGFQTMKVTDLQTHIEQTTTYFTDFPQTGLVSLQTKVCPDGKSGCPSGGVTLNSVQNTYDIKALGAGTDNVQRTFVALKTSIVNSTDLDGTAMPTDTDTYKYDCDTLVSGLSICAGTTPTGFGNTTSIVASISDGSSRTTANTYANDTANWFLGRLVTAKVTSAVPNHTTQTRQTAYCYSLSIAHGTSCLASDAPTGLLTTEFVEPETSSDPSRKLETDYKYDGFGNKIETDVTGCVWVSSTSCTSTTRSSYTEFDTTTLHGQFATKATNALSTAEHPQFETWAFATTTNTGFGVPSGHTGPNGITTSWSYDVFGRRILETRADNTKTLVAYYYCVQLPCANLPTTITSIPNSTQFFAIAAPERTTDNSQYATMTVTYYDSLSRPLAVDIEGFSSHSCETSACWIRTETQYGTGGRVHRTSRPYFLSGGTAQWTTNDYDALGRITKSTFPDNSNTTFEFHGLTTSATNAKSKKTTTVKNAQGLIASVQDAYLKTTSYDYDVFNNLVTITDPATPANVTTYAYDIRGRKITATDGDTGTWHYIYTGFGELSRQTDAKGQLTTLTYDLLGRVLIRTEADLTSTFTYDEGARGIGHLTSETTGANFSRNYYFYDIAGRPSSTTTTIDGNAYNYIYSYHSDQQISTITYPSGFVVYRAPTNILGYLYQLFWNDGTGQLLWRGSSRDAEQHILTEMAGNNVVTTETYYPETGLPHTTTAGSSNSIANQSYTFDALGNLTQRTWAKTATATVTENACYDDLNRVYQYKVGGACSAAGHISVDYDSLGNITRKSDVCDPGQGVQCMFYGENGDGPHALTSIHYNDGSTGTLSYDQNGNMSSGNGRIINVNSFNMAGSITEGSTTLSITYDSQHQRIKQVGSDGSITYYLNDPVTGAIEEKFVIVSPNQTTTTWRDYLLADGKMVGERFCVGSASPCTATPTWNYFVLDHLGSVSVVTDDVGSVIERLSFDPWGKRRNADGTPAACGTITSSSTRGFTGQEMMDSVCLVNFNARMYDPTLGRFLSADPVIGNLYDLQALNRYSYVGNNPLSLTDPSGLCFLGCFWNSDIFKTIASIVIAFVLPDILGEVEGALGATEVEGESVLGLVNVGIAGGVAGYVTTGKLSGALSGALQAELFVGVGDKLESNPAWFLGSPTASEFVAHGMVGGIVSSLSGGRYGSGFLAAGVGSLADSPVLHLNNFGLSVAEHAVLGGAGSVLGGGKFSNGAVTAAFGYLFNYMKHLVGYAQQLRQQVEAGRMTDVEAMARIADKLAGAGLSDDEFVNQFGSLLSGANLGNFMHPGRSSVAFGQTGFDPEYQEPFGPNNPQVRHFVGFFVLGYATSQEGFLGMDASTTYLAFRELYGGAPSDTVQDYNLGVIGIELGFSLRYSLDQAVIGGWIRNHVAQ